MVVYCTAPCSYLSLTTGLTDPYMCSVIDAGVVIGNYTAFEALEPGNNIGVNDVLRRPTVSYYFKVKPENGSTVVIVRLFPVRSLLHKGK